MPRTRWSSTRSRRRGTQNLLDRDTVPARMDELSRRYWVLYYAGKAGNWELAGYMERESEKIVGTAAVARPKYREDIGAFVRDRLGPVARAIEAKDWRAFDVAYHRGIEDSNMYHDKYNKRFIRFRLPDHPPEWFDLVPR